MEEQLKQLMLDVEQGDLGAMLQLQLIVLSILDPQLMLALVLIAQAAPAPTVVQMLTGGLAPRMKRGGVVNYLKYLRGQCPEGYEMQIFRSGGKATCKKCVKMKEKGGNVESKGDVIELFKCGRRMKKKACGGNLKKK